jgi:hypothetical protein
MQFHELSESEVTFSLECEPEDDRPEDHFSEPEDAQWVRDELNSGNDWAWFTAKVTAQWKNWKGTDYLGACSYNSEAEFRADDYFASMKSEALADLNRTLRAEWCVLSARCEG